MRVPSRPLYFLIIFYFLLLSDTIAAQRDTLTLPKITVSSSVRLQPVGQTAQTYRTDSLPAGGYQNLAEVLATESGLFIRSYGLGSLAVSTLRGGSAGHTLTLWNGLPLQNPMLGQIDLSLLPLNAGTDIRLERGGNTTAWGSGAIGGTIRLQSRADFNRGFSAEVRTEVGSFNHFGQSARVSSGNEKIRIEGKYDRRTADNDFSYFVAEGLPERTQTNAALRQQNFLQNLHWKPDNRQQFALHLWQQLSDRQIPPTNVQNSSDARQEDRAFRAVADYKFITDAVVWNAKVGWYDETIDYFDSALLTGESLNRFQSLFAEASAQMSVRGGHRWQNGLTFNHNTAQTVNYAAQPRENRTSLFSSFLFDRPRYRIKADARILYANARLHPFTPALAADWHLHNKVLLQGKVSRNYRLPTLNDRFWVLGGNADLLPEAGWSEEISIVTQQQRKNMRAKVILTAFHRLLKNQILWSRKTGEAFFSPDNIAEVRSYGTEMNARLDVSKNSWRFGGLVNYDYTKSVNRIAVENPNIAAGTQLFYTPEHRVTGQIKIGFRNFFVVYLQQYTSATNGINEVLPGYFYANVRLMYRVEKTKLSGSFFLTINNLYDTDYFIIERRPLPGRHLRAGLRIKFQQKDRTKL